MPAAIQRLALGVPGGVPIRMRSAGLLHGSGGVEVSVPLILKSPSASSVAAGESWEEKVGGGPAATWQKSVAKTVGTPPLVPILFVPASTRPLPSALMSPFSLTFASNLRITQGALPGETPRTTFAVVTLAAGITPIPPSNSTRVPAIADGASIIIPRTTLVSPIDPCFMVGPPFPRVYP